MGIGPITIFDKSALEGLSLDEAALFGHFYQVVITPIFYIEALADLEKTFSDGRHPDTVVARAAEKMSGMGARANADHRRLCLSELLGVQSVPLRGFPALAGGRNVRDGNRRGVVFRQAPELDALARWSRGEFAEVERLYARDWRSALTAIDLEGTYRDFKPFADRFQRPKSLAETKKLVAGLISDPANAESALGFALTVVGVDPVHFGPILERWRAAGSPALTSFVPYTAHVATVDLFFGMALALDQIYRGRPTNRVDIAYLYYLPFCQVFVSRDRLHRNCAQPFLREGQTFVWGDDLKADLKVMDSVLSNLPAETLAQGLIRCASDPPPEASLTCGLWKRRGDISMREPEAAEEPLRAIADDPHDDSDLSVVGQSSAKAAETPAARTRDIVAEVNRITQAPTTGEVFDIQDADFVVLEQVVAMKVGKWQLLPPDAAQGRPPAIP